MQNILQETITGNRIVKAFGMETWEIARFRNAAQRLFRANLRSVAAAAISSPLMDIFGAIAIALLLLLGREQIAHNQITLGAFIAFVAAVFSLYNPVRKFAVFNNSFQQALGASSQIFRFMDAEDVVQKSPAPRRCRHFSKRSGSKMSASPTSRTASRAKSCTTSIWKSEHGEILAIVGSSGAGKSTLVT